MNSNLPDDVAGHTPQHGDYGEQQICEMWRGHRFEEMKPDSTWNKPWRRCRHCGYSARAEILDAAKEKRNEPPHLPSD